nr:Scr1 family TA system antitoxin-like transcriptional regulator [Gandjariella thermophila]
MYVQDPDQVDAYTKAAERMRTVALSPADSAAAIQLR